MFQHPKNVCIGYKRHFKLSMRLSGLFLRRSTKAFVHGIYPDIYITSSTDTVNRINEELSKFGCRK